MRELRIIADDEVAAYVVQCGETFDGSTPKPEEVALWSRVFERERCLGYFEAGKLFATSGAYSLDLSLPGGGSLPTAGISAVTVQPTHRRQGALTEMMRRLLRDAAERGEPIAALYASEGGIYGRFGFGLASYGAELELDRAQAAMKIQPDLSGIEYLRPAAALDFITEVERAYVPGQPGAIARPPRQWEGELADLESHRRGRSNLYLAAFVPGSDRAGFALYRKEMSWEGGGPSGRLHLVSLLTLSRAAYAALWRHLLDVDLMVRLIAPNRPLDEPLRHLLQDPHALRQSVGAELWLNLLDVPRALAARHYQVAGSLRVRISSTFWPDSAGTYSLEAGPDGAECAKTGESADLELPAQSLAAAYLGGSSFTTLYRAGQVEECQAGALARADAMFGWPVQPWCNTGF